MSDNNEAMSCKACGEPIGENASEDAVKYGLCQECYREQFWMGAESALTRRKDFGGWGR